MEGCTERRPSIDLLIDGELDPTARADLEAHLAGCSACSKTRALLERTNRALAAPAPPSPVEWAILLDRARRARSLGWRGLAAAVLLAVAIPASLAAALHGRATTWSEGLVPAVTDGEL